MNRLIETHLARFRAILSAYVARGVLVAVACGVLALVSLAVCGCGQSGPKVVEVTGTITHQGKPVANLIVNFEPEKGRPSWGFTDAEGKYTLSYDKKRDGAVTGTHVVWVKFRPRNPGAEMRAGATGNTLPAVLKKYGSAKATPLSFEITTDGQVVDIELE